MAKDLSAWCLTIKQPLHNYCYLRLYLTLVFIVANENPLLAIYTSKYPSKPYIPKYNIIILYFHVIFHYLLIIVPRFSSLTTLYIESSSKSPNTSIGMLFSIQRVTAVASITFNLSFITCIYVISS